MSATVFKHPRAIEPADIVVGLGCADRAFLSLCIALFDDTSLLKRLGGWYASMVVHRLDHFVDCELAIDTLFHEVTQSQDALVGGAQRVSDASAHPATGERCRDWALHKFTSPATALRP